MMIRVVVAIVLACLTVSCEGGITFSPRRIAASVFGVVRGGYVLNHTVYILHTNILFCYRGMFSKVERVLDRWIEQCTAVSFSHLR